MKLLRRFYRYLRSLNGDYLEKEEVASIEKRLQMLIALVFFTPTVLGSLGSDTLQQNGNILVWCLIVAVYLAVFLIIELTKGKLNKFKGNILNCGIWFNLSAFIPFLLFMAIYKPDDAISGLPLIGLFITITAVFWSPIIVALMLSLEFALGEFFSFVDTIKKVSYDKTTKGNNFNTERVWR
jgi:hypothetical protein